MPFTGPISGDHGRSAQVGPMAGDAAVPAAGAARALGGRMQGIVRSEAIRPVQGGLPPVAYVSLAQGQRPIAIRTAIHDSQVDLRLTPSYAFRSGFADVTLHSPETELAPDALGELIAQALESYGDMPARGLRFRAVSFQTLQAVRQGEESGLAAAGREALERVGFERITAECVPSSDRRSTELLVRGEPTRSCAPPSLPRPSDRIETIDGGVLALRSIDIFFPPPAGAGPAVGLRAASQAYVPSDARLLIEMTATAQGEILRQDGYRMPPHDFVCRLLSSLFVGDYLRGQPLAFKINAAAGAAPIGPGQALRLAEDLADILGAGVFLVQEAALPTPRGATSPESIARYGQSVPPQAALRHPHGKPFGRLLGWGSEAVWFERLEPDPVWRTPGAIGIPRMPNQSCVWPQRLAPERSRTARASIADAIQARIDLKRQIQAVGFPVERVRRSEDVFDGIPTLSTEQAHAIVKMQAVPGLGLGVGDFSDLLADAPIGARSLAYVNYIALLMRRYGVWIEDLQLAIGQAAEGVAPVRIADAMSARLPVPHAGARNDAMDDDMRAQLHGMRTNLGRAMAKAVKAQEAAAAQARALVELESLEGRARALVAALDEVSQPDAAFDLAAHALYAKALHDLAREPGMERAFAAMQTDRSMEEDDYGALRMSIVDLAARYRKYVRDGVAALARSRPGALAMTPAVVETAFAASWELANKLGDYLDGNGHRRVARDLQPSHLRYAATPSEFLPGRSRPFDVFLASWAAQLQGAAAILTEPALPRPGNAAEWASCLQEACLRALRFEAEVRHLGRFVRAGIGMRGWPGIAQHSRSEEGDLPGLLQRLQAQCHEARRADPADARAGLAQRYADYVRDPSSQADLSDYGMAARHLAAMSRTWDLMGTALAAYQAGDLQWDAALRGHPDLVHALRLHAAPAAPLDWWREFDLSARVLENQAQEAAAAGSVAAAGGMADAAQWRADEHAGFAAILNSAFADVGRPQPVRDEIVVLDTACGRCDEAGVLADFFRAGGRPDSVRIVGIDRDPERIRIARENYAGRPERFTFVAGDAGRLGAHAEIPVEADVVVVRRQNAAGGHPGEWAGIFSQASARLRPDGVLVLTSLSKQEHDAALELLIGMGLSVQANQAVEQDALALLQRTGQPPDRLVAVLGKRAAAPSALPLQPESPGLAVSEAALGQAAQQLDALADAAGSLRQRLIQAWGRASYPELDDRLPPPLPAMPRSMLAADPAVVPPDLAAIAESQAAAAARLEALAAQAMATPPPEPAPVPGTTAPADGHGWTVAKAQRHAMVYYRFEDEVAIKSLADDRIDVRVRSSAERPGRLELTLSSYWPFAPAETAPLLAGLLQAYGLRPSAISWSSQMGEYPLDAPAAATECAAIGAKLADMLGAERVDHLFDRPFDDSPQVATPITVLAFADRGDPAGRLCADALILPPSDAVRPESFSGVAGPEGSFTVVVRTSADGRMLHPDGHAMAPEEASFYLLDCPGYELGRPVTLVTEHGDALAAAWAALLRVPVATAAASASAQDGTRLGQDLLKAAVPERRDAPAEGPLRPAHLRYAVGRGDEKILYADSRGRVVGIARPGKAFGAALARMHQERQLTARLGRRGVPIVDIEEIGSVFDRPSIVYGKEYPSNTEAIRLLDLESMLRRIQAGGPKRYDFTRTDWFSERTLDAIARIRRGMDVGIPGDDEPVEVTDFEAMIDDDGALFVNDPIDLRPARGNGRQHLMLSSLEDATLAKLGRSIPGEPAG